MRFLSCLYFPYYISQAGENLGTVLLSLCYSPDAKKLSVIILRAKDLNKGIAKEIGESWLVASLMCMHGNHKISVFIVTYSTRMYM